MSTNTAPSFLSIIGDGKVTTAVGLATDTGRSVTVQADGKILVAGDSAVGSSYDFALVRYNSDGSLDTSFSTDGKVTTAVGALTDFGQSVTVQADGKVLVAGYIQVASGGFDFALVRYNSDGSLDTGFDGDGKVTTNLSSASDEAFSVAVQADGKILVAGYARIGVNDDFVLVRYNSDGSLDSSFDGDGIVTTAVTASTDQGHSVTVQTDGKILVAGTSNVPGTGKDFALARYNSDGSLDTSFGGDGIVTTAVTASVDAVQSVTLQADGKILVAGTSYNGSNYDFALVRYNSDGSLDSSFDGDGKVITDLGSHEDGYSVTVQADGKILVAGDGLNGNNWDFALVRYNSDGSLDTGFDGDGKVFTAVGASSEDRGYSVTVQADGKILVAGTSLVSGGRDFALVRYNADGSLDTSFDGVTSLNNTAHYTENGPAVVLDSTVQIADPELAAQGHYNGASITLARHGGANGADRFFGSGNLGFNGGNALLSGVSIGTVSNSGGTLTITFNNNATQARVNEALSSLAYSNSSNTPPASVLIDWAFNDGNSGAQGTGGALTALGSTTVTITEVHDNAAPGFLAGDGKVITDFGSTNDIGGSVTVQADGKILVAGTSITGNKGNFALARYHADGSLDTSFDGDGKISTDFGATDDYGASVILQTDGKIVVAGYSSKFFALARYHADGSLDTSFDVDGRVVTTGIDFTYGYSVKAQADGKILVAGTSTSKNGDNADFALMRYNPDGFPGFQL